jgi:membrane protease YdiL (CAAX protease family)
MDTAIGAMLRARPRLLRIAILAAVILVGADMAIIMLGLDDIYRLTLALLGSLFCAFISSAEPLTGPNSFGFRLEPRQGWLFWVRTGFIVGTVVLIILLCAGIGLLALGYNVLQKPRLASVSQIGPLFVWMCITVPLFEEILYRLVLCPPVAALLGVRSCIVLNGLVFGGLHVLYGNPSPENLLGGFILSWAFLKSQTLIVPILLHASGNLFAFLGQVAHFYWCYYG